MKADNLYSMALEASISEMEKQWGHIDDSNNGSGIRTDYHHVRVRKNPELTDDLPPRFGDHQVEYLDDQALIESYKTLRKEFSVLDVHPVHNDGSRLRIQISVSWFKYKNGRSFFGLSDWSDVEFQFDCESQTFVLSAVKLGGI